jgi:serine/threonine protein kinase
MYGWSLSIVLVPHNPAYLTAGGELYEYLLKRKRLKEPVVQRMFAQLVGAVIYIHKAGCVHR